jgi:hypothetical protein
MDVSSLWFAVWPIIVSVRKLDENERCFDEEPTCGTIVTVLSLSNFSHTRSIRLL